ncbi:MAG: hypothetical protein CL570_04375 [Alphaproteobacteria bacterium]|nr:hypothetical protein [Alphaproteobacteria bacterium]|tara:strand:- start:655 stop:2178 length:1524 start_codon:yes stop_codon:yes gene_type:complete
MQAVILARISSKEQRDGHSLDAQTRNLEQYAQRKQLNVIRKFTLVESSNKRFRPEFDKMIIFIKKQKTKVALIVDTVDRLQRSFRETPILNDLMSQDLLELHFVKEGNILSKHANSVQKLMWNMGVVMSQSYTDQLSDNVKRSFDFKVRNGEWCAQAPIGYKNATDVTTGKSTIVVDEDKADLIKQIFIEYASGLYSISSLSKQAYGWGLRSRNGCKVCPQLLHTLLQNPFYYGVMRVKGKLYEHKYDALISKELFNKCQYVRMQRSKTKVADKTKHTFLFSGVFICSASKRVVSCDMKKGKYVYLICRDPDNHSKKLWVNERSVVDQMQNKIDAFHLSNEDLPVLIEYTQHTLKLQKQHDKEIIYTLQKECDEIERQIDKATELLIDNCINQDVYERKYSELKQKHSDITVLINDQLQDTELLERSIILLLKLCNKASLLFKSSKTTLKRTLLKTLFSNRELNAGNVQCTTVLPLLSMLKTTDLREWQGQQGSNPRPTVLEICSNK